jgi:hypothetical protein
MHNALSTLHDTPKYFISICHDDDDDDEEKIDPYGDKRLAHDQLPC